MARSATILQPESWRHGVTRRDQTVSRAILTHPWAASSVGRAPPLHGGGRRRTAPQDARVAPTIGPAVCNPVCKPWGRDTGGSAEVDERRPLIMAFPSDSRKESNHGC